MFAGWCRSGEPYLKDMALAIRYAVDHGSDVIVLPQQNTLYPRIRKHGCQRLFVMQKARAY